MPESPAPNSQFQHGEFYLAAAANRDMDAQTIRRWLARGDTPNSDDGEGWTVLHTFAQRGNTEAVRALVEAGANPKLIGRSGLSALHVARNGEIARLLIEAGTDVNSRGFVGETPMHTVLNEAREAPWPEVVGTVQALIVAGADVNATTGGRGSHTPLDFAARIKDDELRDQLRTLLTRAGGVSGKDLPNRYGAQVLSKRQADSPNRGVS